MPQVRSGIGTPLGTRSIDVFFKQLGNRVRPNYNKHQSFPPANSKEVRSLTKDAIDYFCILFDCFFDALNCFKNKRETSK